MKKCLLMLALAFNAIQAQVKFTGYILSSDSSLPLVGAIIYLPDLKSGTVSKLDGSFEIFNLPKQKVLMQVKLLGYKTEIVNIDLNEYQNLNFHLKESVLEGDEVVVTGVSRATEIKKNPIPMVFIDERKLNQNSSSNLVEAIAKVPGVNAYSSGPNIAKPFIRGLGFNRILTLFDGIRQEGQQWGEEHGIEMDQNLINRAEIVKGPASLIYGSDALAGVINFLPNNICPQGIVRGNFGNNYQSNNELFASSLNVEGNKNGLSFRIVASTKDAIDYKNKLDGRVYNTGYLEKDIYAQIGIARAWGYSNLSVSVFDNVQEIPSGNRDSSTRKFTKQVTEHEEDLEIVSNKELNQYAISAIHQHIQHYRVFSNNQFFIGKSRLSFKLGHQQNIRKEFSHPLAVNIPGLSLQLNTSTYDVKYFFPDYKNFETTIGVNGMNQQNNLMGSTEFIIPKFNLFDVGTFLFVKKKIKDFDFLFGARYDWRKFKNEELYVASNAITGFDGITIKENATETFFSNYSHLFQGASGSFGAAYNANKNLILKYNVAQGYRAPNISEISAKGVHPGSGFEQLGDENLKPEFNFQNDLGIFYDREHFSFSAELFNNTISNYIFNQKLQSKTSGDSLYVEAGNNYQVFKFVQTKANLTGGEISFDLHPHPFDWLHFENFVSYIYAQNLGTKGLQINYSNKYLPFIPPFQFNSEIRMEQKKKCKNFVNSFFKVTFVYSGNQNNIFSAYNTETKTPYYFLLNIGMGTEMKNKKNATLCILSLFVNNALDRAYQSHLSRLKYMDNYPVNGTGKSGIYEMGRNVSVKISIPFSGELKTKSR